MKISFMNNLKSWYHQNYMNVLGLISRVIGIETLRLTISPFLMMTHMIWYFYTIYDFEAFLEKCRHRRKNPSNLILFLFYFRFLFFLDPDPHLASIMCVLYLFSVSRCELCVCVGTCVRVCVWAQIWSRHQSWEILRCDWAPMSNRFYLV